MGGKTVSGNESIEIKATLLKGHEVTFNISASVGSGLVPEITAWFNYGYLFISVDCDTQTYSDPIELVITSNRQLFNGLTTSDFFQTQTSENVKVFTNISPYQCIFRYLGSPENPSRANFMCCSLIGKTHGGAGVENLFPLCKL